MNQSSQHGRLLNAAAKAALAPLGCKRVGQSRVWVSDERFWIIMTEFQPSGFSKGSYLNVGAMWLWYPKTHRTFDYGYRVENFIEFVDEVQFREAAEKLATRAAEEVTRLRDIFSSPTAIAARLVADTDERKLDIGLYHAAIAAGLVGDLSTSASMFEQLASGRAPHNDWYAQLRVKAAELAAVLSERDHFRSAVLKIIEDTRAAIRLPLDAGCLDSCGSEP